MAEEPEADKTVVLARLSRVEGQIRGIRRMIEAGRDCESVITQLMAARAALDRASLLIVSRHLEHCLRDLTSEANRQQLTRILQFLIELAPTVPEPPQE